MTNVVRLASDLQPDSIVDGEGIRTVIWFQGCRHACKGCHNPESWDCNAGFEKNIDELLKELSELENQRGITLSGGEPMLQPDAALMICKFAKSLGLDIWSWTGFTFEQLLKMAEINPVYFELLENIDVLVDGKFELDKFSLNCKFRGSTNQKILDVKESLKTGRPINYKNYD